MIYDSPLCVYIIWYCPCEIFHKKVKMHEKICLLQKFWSDFSVYFKSIYLITSYNRVMSWIILLFLYNLYIHIHPTKKKISRKTPIFTKFKFFDDFALIVYIIYGKFFGVWALMHIKNKRAAHILFVLAKTTPHFKSQLFDPYLNLFILASVSIN